MCVRLPFSSQKFNETEQINDNKHKYIIYVLIRLHAETERKERISFVNSKNGERGKNAYDFCLVHFDRMINIQNTQITSRTTDKTLFGKTLTTNIKEQRKKTNDKDKW